MVKDFHIAEGNEDVTITNDETDIQAAQEEGRFSDPDHRPENPGEWPHTDVDPDRYRDIERLHDLIEELYERLGGLQTLESVERSRIPERGIYIFFASDEVRTMGDGFRVTRIGTYAMREGEDSTLWDRLRTHRGTDRGKYPGGGYHRKSIFREHVGQALIEANGLHDQYPEWGTGRTYESATKDNEYDLEQRVSDFIRDLPFLWLAVDDEPGADSDRKYLERNLIALLSNYECGGIDPREDDWLGAHSQSEAIRESGLWNVDHVDEAYDPDFLEKLEEYVFRVDSRYR